MTTILLLFLLLPSGDFDRLKTLVGEWEATSPEGKARVTYQLISNGTALMETVYKEGDNMVTIYHPDGDTILATHYCSIGNQPRMRAPKSASADSITFHFVDVSNVHGGEHGHISGLVIKFKDADHVTEEWTYRDKDKEGSSVFNLRRVK